MDGPALILLVGRHSESVRKRTVVCETTVCCHCGLDAANGGEAFTFHGTRPRRFLVLVGSYVCSVAALLARWRCPHCDRTFTDYPEFACPYKVYTVPQMTERADKYVSNTATSYRRGVRFDNRSIFYAESSSSKTDQQPDGVAIHTLAHSSLFRWVTTLADVALRQPRSWRVDFAPAPHKYKSAQRRLVLMACRAACSGLFAAHASA